MNDPLGILMDSVEKTDECWVWTGRISQYGYGVFSSHWAAKHGLSSLAHRAIYQLVVGDPGRLELDHTCHDGSKCDAGNDCLHRRCVNPAHLEPVTHLENVRRGSKALKTECKHGHPLTKDNTGYQTNGTRRCLTCHRNWMARYREVS